MGIADKGARVGWGMRAKRNTVLAKYVGAWLVPAIVLSAGQLAWHGHITAPVLAVDAVACAVFPFGLLWLVLVLTDGGRPDEEEGGDHPGGSPPEDVEPEPPLGGFEIDWERFEADVQAYAESRVCV